MFAIIGAGPAGSHLASCITKQEAKQGAKQDVMLFDKKTEEEIGRPVQCTGIFTSSIYRVLDLPDGLVQNRIRTFRMIAPDGKSLDVAMGKENLVVNRTEFDNFLLRKAKANGASLKLGHEFTGLELMPEKRIKLFFKGKQPVIADYVVGADGPHSQVAQAAGLYGDRTFLQGLQYRVEGTFEPEVTLIHFGLGEFAWTVPEDEHTARVGVIGNNVDAAFRKMTRGMKVIENQSGIIPLYNPRQRLQKGRIALIGDAATQVKATTYGGIIYGLLAGTYIAEGWADYPARFNRKLGRDLWISLKMRQALNRFTDRDCSELIAIFEKETNKKFLQEHDRDFPSKFIFQLLMKEARLWKLGFKLFT